MSVIRCLLTVATNVKTATRPCHFERSREISRRTVSCRDEPHCCHTPLSFRAKSRNLPAKKIPVVMKHSAALPLFKLRRSRHHNLRPKGPSNLRTFRTKAGQSLEPCQYPPRRVLTTAFIHDNVDISIENDEEKSSYTENGEASPESGSGYG